MSARCNLCGCVYKGLAGDCMCTNWGVTPGIPPMPPPPADDDPVTGIANMPEVSELRQKLARSRMAIASAVEDHAYLLVHAYVKILREGAYLTQEAILETLEELDESLQAPPGE